MATAAGTLVLAVATFGSVRASKRSTELAERSLLAGVRPLLIPSREDDPSERVRFGDGYTLDVPGHGGIVDFHEGNLYLGMALRNGGAGLAVIHGWQVSVGRPLAHMAQPDPDTFRPQSRDMYVPAGDTGFWQGAIRDREDPVFEPVREASEADGLVMVDLLYGDFQGGQRTITRFRLSHRPGEGPRCEVLRVWVLEGIDPRDHA
jgi:hypothetical protein